MLKKILSNYIKFVAFTLVITLLSMFSISLITYYLGIGAYLISAFLIGYYFIKYYKETKNPFLIAFYVIFIGFGYWIETLVMYVSKLKVNNTALEIFKKLNKLNIKYHLVCGTLLFFHRNKTFMDFDIDLGVWTNDFKKIDFKKLEESGFKIAEAWKVNGKWAEVSLKYKKNNVQVDLFVLERNKTLICGIHEKKQIIVTRKNPIKYKTKEIKFHDLKICVPEDEDKFLTWLYGEWQIPKPFHWLKGNEDIKPVVIKVKIDYYKNDMAYKKLTM